MVDSGPVPPINPIFFIEASFAGYRKASLFFQYTTHLREPQTNCFREIVLRLGLRRKVIVGKTALALQQRLEFCLEFIAYGGHPRVAADAVAFLVLISYAVGDVAFLGFYA